MGRFNRVARANPVAAFPTRWTPRQIDTPSPANRPLAFPYNKWHATQWTVNQAAALLLCSAEVARRLRVPADRWVFPLVGLESSHAVSLLRRREPYAWPAMGVLGRAAAARIGRPVAEGESSRSTAASPPPCGSSSGSWAWTSPAPRRSPEGWPSPVARSTTSSCRRWCRWSHGSGPTRGRSAW